MSLAGIWTTEYYAQDGWQNIGVLIFEHGRALGGGRNHYCYGKYKAKGKSLKFELHIEIHGETQTFFGARDESFDVVAEGKLAGDVFTGTLARPDRSRFSLQLRATRRAGLDAGG